MHGQVASSNVAGRVLKFLAENEKLLVVAASTCIMSLSHTALRPRAARVCKGGQPLVALACTP